MTGTSEYPKKLPHNPIEHSEFPKGKSIDVLQRWLEDGQQFFYVGYGSGSNDAAGNIGPVWLLKHQPSPCQFIRAALINEESVGTFNVNAGTLYLAGKDAHESTPPVVVCAGRYMIIGYRDCTSGEIRIGAFDSDQLFGEGGEIDDSVMLPLPDAPGDTTSCFAIVCRDPKPEEPMIVVLYTDRGELRYRTGVVQALAAGELAITWYDGGEVRVHQPESDTNEIVWCEQVAAACDGGGHIVIAYRDFGSFHVLQGEAPTRGALTAKQVTGDDRLVGRTPSIVLADDGRWLLAYRAAENEQIVLCSGDREKYTAPLSSNVFEGLKTPALTLYKESGHTYVGLVAAGAQADGERFEKGRLYGTAGQWPLNPRPIVPEFTPIGEISAAGDNRNPAVATMSAADGATKWLVVSESGGKVRSLVCLPGAGSGASVPEFGDLKVLCTLTDGWDMGNFYRLEDGGWKKYRTVPDGVHVFTIVAYEVGGASQLFAGTRGARIQQSSDQGETWKTAPGFRGGVNKMFRLSGGLYAEAETTVTLWRLNDAGTSFELASYDPAQTDPMRRVIEAREDLVLCLRRSSKKLSWLERSGGGVALHEIPTREDVIDVALFEDYVYILSHVDGAPRIYRCSLDQITRATVSTWAPCGSDASVWKAQAWGSREATSLAVGAARDHLCQMYVGADDGSIWVDVPAK